MKIQHPGADGSRTEAVRSSRVAAAEIGAKPAAQADATLVRRDRVQISETGRALSAQLAADEPARTTAPLTPERIAALRQQVLDGAYNSIEMVDQVARRILQSGDL
jgi:negative regulator of flagellin synthesis FlgM